MRRKPPRCQILKLRSRAKKNILLNDRELPQLAYVALTECELEYVHVAFPRFAICVKTMHDKLYRLCSDFTDVRLGSAGGQAFH